MHSVSARLAACLVAAVTVGCGTVAASHSESGAHTAAPATAGNPGQNSGVPTASPASTVSPPGTAGPGSGRGPAGGQGAAPAGAGVKNPLITVARKRKRDC